MSEAKTKDKLDDKADTEMLSQSEQKNSEPKNKGKMLNGDNADKTEDKPSKKEQTDIENRTNAKMLKSAAKRGLKVMKKTHEKHPLREETRILKYGTKGFARNIWLSTAATVVMTLTLVITFVTVVASMILSNTAETMREKIDITIYLQPNTPKETLDELSDIVKQDENVKSVTVSTSEEEFQKFLSENSESDEILTIMDEEMRALMIAKMQATMRLKVHDTENFDTLKQIVEENQVFQANLDSEMEPTYDVNQVEIATITSWANIARTGGMILAAVFLAISVLIIFSTIRMAIFSRREEIYMMKLVGADKRFIRGPFLVEAEICGVIAGVVAATISYFGFKFVAPYLASYGIEIDSVMRILESNQLIFIYLIFIGVGFIIGRVSARLAVSKYLHKK